MNQTQLSLIPGALAFSKLSRLFILHLLSLVVQLMLVSRDDWMFEISLQRVWRWFLSQSLRGTCVSIAEPIMK